MYCRGIRGATTVERNEREEMLAATIELLRAIMQRNELQAEDIASAFFTVTDDLDAAFPALAARELGWTEVALMCAREIPVPGSLEKCIRVLLHVNTERGAAEMQHVYLRRASVCARNSAWAREGLLRRNRLAYLREGKGIGYHDDDVRMCRVLPMESQRA